MYLSCFWKLFLRYTKQNIFLQMKSLWKEPSYTCDMNDDTWPGSQWLPEVGSQAIILPSFICVSNESQLGTIQGPYESLDNMLEHIFLVMFCRTELRVATLNSSDRQIATRPHKPLVLESFLLSVCKNCLNLNSIKLNEQVEFLRTQIHSNPRANSFNYIHVVRNY